MPDSGPMPDFPGIPRERLAITPTPLRPAPRLSEALGAEIWFKRDDLLGLGLGGNKARPLEFLLGDALARGCDVLVTGSGAQSNWSLLASLAARRCDLESVVCLYGDPPAEARGNLALHRLISSQLVWTGDPSRESVDLRIAEIAADLESAGRRPYVVPRGGATSLGSLGYLLAAREIADQCATAGIVDPTVWLATGSCGTQAGLVAGVGGGSLPRVIGVTVSRPMEECRERVLRLATGAADLAGISPPAPGDVHVLDGYLGPGYGYASEEGAAATELVLRTEGVFLDPPFCAKAMAALVDAAREGTLTGATVFLVSGGAPTLFVQDGPL